MQSNLAKELDERFRRYKELAAKGTWKSAVIALAEIFHCASKLPKAQGAEWVARVSDEQLSDDAMEQAEAGIKEKIQRLRRILSIGNRWTGEEILLVVQTRIEIELLTTYLSEKCPTKPSPSLDDIDEDIVALSKSKEHQYDFKWAVGMMKKNWGLPIDSRWLKET
ncbi:MAG: hypothetical protein ACRD9S_19905 [Pyrinomonadaceae bacterium]